MRLGYYLLKVSHDVLCGIREDEVRAGAQIEDAEAVPVSQTEQGLGAAAILQACQSAASTDTTLCESP